MRLSPTFTAGGIKRAARTGAVTNMPVVLRKMHMYPKSASVISTVLTPRNSCLSHESRQVLYDPLGETR